MRAGVDGPQPSPSASVAGARRPRRRRVPSPWGRISRLTSRTHGWTVTASPRWLVNLLTNAIKFDSARRAGASGSRHPRRSEGGGHCRRGLRARIAPAAPSSGSSIASGKPPRRRSSARGSASEMPSSIVECRADASGRRAHQASAPHSTSRFPSARVRPRPRRSAARGCTRLGRERARRRRAGRASCSSARARRAIDGASPTIAMVDAHRRSAAEIAGHGVARSRRASDGPRRRASSRERQRWRICARPPVVRIYTRLVIVLRPAFDRPTASSRRDVLPRAAGSRIRIGQLRVRRANARPKPGEYGNVARTSTADCRASLALPGGGCRMLDRFIPWSMTTPRWRDVSRTL